MTFFDYKNFFRLRILETAKEMIAVEDLQRVVWPGNETEIVPGHLFLTAAHNGGIVIGAYQTIDDHGNPLPNLPQSLLAESEELPPEAKLIGFVFGFPGLYETPNGLRIKHCSHMLAVHPSVRDRGVGYALKRAQWQMVRNQRVDRITWTFDPLQSRNAHLNIARLGAVCNTYIRDAYGEMRDGINAGLPSDRLQVDWWVNSQRVNRRLSKRPRLQLDLAHFLAAGTPIINPSKMDGAGYPHPIEVSQVISENTGRDDQPILILEIPADFQKLKSVDVNLALVWKLHVRNLFEFLFERGFWITDFVYLPGPYPRSFYVLSNGDYSL